MICVLFIFQAVLVIGIVLFTLGFLITSLKEKKPIAVMMVGALCGLLVVMEICIYSLYSLNFFPHFAGKLVLVSAWMAAGAVVYFLCCRTDPNQRALKGAEGHAVGQAQ